MALSVSENEPTLRVNVLALNKQFSKGSAAEIQTVLGWTIKKRAFSVYLLGDKHKAWSN